MAAVLRHRPVQPAEAAVGSGVAIRHLEPELRRRVLLPRLRERLALRARLLIEQRVERHADHADELRARPRRRLERDHEGLVRVRDRELERLVPAVAARHRPRRAAPGAVRDDDKVVGGRGGGEVGRRADGERDVARHLGAVRDVLGLELALERVEEAVQLVDALLLRGDLRAEGGDDEAGVGERIGRRGAVEQLPRRLCLPSVLERPRAAHAHRRPTAAAAAAAVAAAARAAAVLQREPGIVASVGDVTELEEAEGRRAELAAAAAAERRLRARVEQRDRHLVVPRRDRQLERDVVPVARAARRAGAAARRLHHLRAQLLAAERHDAHEGGRVAERVRRAAAAALCLELRDAKDAGARRARLERREAGVVKQFGEAGVQRVALGGDREHRALRRTVHRLQVGERRAHAPLGRRVRRQVAALAAALDHRPQPSLRERRLVVGDADAQPQLARHVIIARGAPLERVPHVLRVRARHARALARLAAATLQRDRRRARARRPAAAVGRARLQQLGEREHHHPEEVVAAEEVSVVDVNLQLGGGARDGERERLVPLGAQRLRDAARLRLVARAVDDAVRVGEAVRVHRRDAARLDDGELDLRLLQPHRLVLLHRRRDPLELARRVARRRAHQPVRALRGGV